jgi:hypothetical protein
VKEGTIVNKKLLSITYVISLVFMSLPVIAQEVSEKQREEIAREVVKSCQVSTNNCKTPEGLAEVIRKICASRTCPKDLVEPISEDNNSQSEDNNSQQDTK